MQDKNKTVSKYRSFTTPSHTLSRESWKIFQIMAEFVEGFEKLTQIHPSVSIFGSARTSEDHPYYQLTEEIALKLSNSGFAVVSGGGPGITGSGKSRRI